MKTVILIPALNEEKTITKVIEAIPKKINSINEVIILVIDDGSTDNTSNLAQEAGAKVIRHSSNQGVGKAFQTGFSAAIEMSADILITLDADGQFDPKEIPQIIQPILDQKADMVTGSRFVDPSFIPKNMPYMKQWGNRRVANIISWATGKKFNDVSCGFRAYNREALLKLNLFGKFTYTQETFLDLAYKGLEIVEVPITVQYFDERKSRVASSLSNYAFKAGNIIFRTIKDYRPLKFFGLSGLIIFLIGCGFDLFVFKHFLENGSFAPYKILGFLGAFLNAIGIMIIFIGILADLIDKVRLTEEKILYYQRKKYYEKNLH